MEEAIAISKINDFIFCPASIYFHGMYEGIEGLLYKEAPQIKGTSAHKHIDEGTKYSSNIVSGVSVYSEQYKLYGKIDRFFVDSKSLVESKRRIKVIYDGYIYQLYAQYFGMVEAGYEIENLYLYSIEDNKKYPIKKPFEDEDMLNKFEFVISQMRQFDINSFSQSNRQKCLNCIYANICFWGLN